MSRNRKTLKRRECVKSLRNQEYNYFLARKEPVVINQEKIIEDKITFRNFVRKIKMIFTDKADTHGNMTIGVFSGLTSLVFNAVAILGLVITFFGACSLIAFPFGINWNTWIDYLKNIYVMFLSGMVLFIVFLCSVIMWGSANEIKREQDKNYIIAVFSGIVSFAALVVALVALFRGVG